MSDWQKILNLVMCEKPNRDEWCRNPLLKIVTEYLYRILSCLEKDFKTGKIPIQEEMKKLVEKISDDKMKNAQIKREFLRINDVDFYIVILIMMRDLFQKRAIIDYINSPSFYKRHKIKKYDLKMLHEMVCKDIFQNMGNSYEYRKSLWVGMEVDSEDESAMSWTDSAFQVEGRTRIKLAIISEDILVYDRFVFDMLQDDSSDIREIIKEIYRPFLVEYYIDQKELGEKQKAFLQQMHQEKGWYLAALTDNTTDIDAVKFITFEGVFVHSASPVEYESKKLVIRDKRVDRVALNAINSTYNMDDVDCASDADIQEELERMFDGVSFHKTRVYKVGDGNCIYSYGKKGNKETRFFYDIGFDIHVNIGSNSKMTEKKYRSALQNIRGSKPHCIILSHWDEDHFRGCAYAKKSFFYIRWIAPNIENSEIKGNAKRLLLYLYRIGSLMVIKRGTAREITIKHSNKSRMILYVGKKGGTNNGIKKNNCEGIAIRIENEVGHSQNIRCLMQGDVPYTCLPLSANFAMENPYEYLVVPHHGAKMNYSLFHSAVKKEGQAVISCTNDMGKNRPEREHLTNLSNCYNDVKCTEQAKRYIQLNLHRKNQMSIC